MRLLLAFIFSLVLAPPVYAVEGELDSLTEFELTDIPRLGDFAPIKFVVYPENGGWTKMRIIDPRVYDFHHDYLKTSYQNLRTISYEPGKRQIMLGTFLFNPSAFADIDDPILRTRFQFTLTTAELPPIDVIAGIQAASTKWFTEKTDIDLLEPIAFRPQPQQEAEVTAKLAEFKKANVRVIFPNKPPGMYVYNVGWGVGQMKAFSTADAVLAGIKTGEVNPDTIMLVSTDLGELPPVAGIISTVPLTEASHMVLLAQMYGIPLVFQENGMELNKANLGKWAILQTEASNESHFELYANISQEELKDIRTLRARKKLDGLKVDWETKEIKEVAALKPDEVPAYGGKNVQFGLIRRTIPEYTRDSVAAIPLYYYKQFLDSSITQSGVTVRQGLRDLMARLSANASYAEVDRVMGEIRKMMKRSKMKPELVAEIRNRLIEFFPGKVLPDPSIIPTRLKLRSSSNVEDGAEFNGAGLYESEGVCLQHCVPSDDFEKGLKKVWSSLFTTRGYWARQQFGVNEDIVGMGVVAQRPYKGEIANGVVKFAKYKDQDQVRVEILGVLGEDESVTAGSVNERVVMTTQGSKDIFRPLAGRDIPIMNQDHYDKLFDLMQQLFDVWPHDKGDYFEIESEWKLITVKNVFGKNEERINLKQVRAVPRPSTPVVNGERRIVTGGTIELTSNWPQQARAMAYRPEKVTLKMKPTTDGQFIQGNVSIEAVQVVIRGETFDYAIDKIQLGEPNDFSNTVQVFLSHARLPQTVLEIILSKNVSTPAITPHSLFLSFEYTYFNATGDRVGWTNLVDASLAPTFAKIVEMNEPFDYQFSGCPVRVKGMMTKGFSSSDSIGYFDDVEVVLKNVPRRGGERKIVLKGFPNSFYTRDIHDQSKTAWFDLFADLTLTATEKSAIARRYGRYLAYDGELVAIAEDLKTEKTIRGCGQQELPE